MKSPLRRKDNSVLKYNYILKSTSGQEIFNLREIVVSNASAAAIRKAQAAFSGAADALGVSSEDDIQALVDEARYGKGR